MRSDEAPLMSGVKRLRSVAHSFAQHALSGLCGDAPERELEQRRTGAARIGVVLIGDRSKDDEPYEDRPHLRVKFVELLMKEAIDPSSLAWARIVFVFRGQCRTADGCMVSIETRDGRRIEKSVGTVSA
ncbi:hypothetical protein [Lysobacter sp. CA199]|uniref:hypothetical protein n=1 Tax=Lysobacter sp. CA199 TaxID=3455608 RepID=UPI003F8D8DE3